jgi:SAM-dependent methyltransferase
MTTAANSDRFSGFADLYDANRQSPPPALGPILCSYANVQMPDVVDLGSGTGLSTRWAASWAGSVVGIEPNDDMRRQAESRPVPNTAYQAGVSDNTGLPDSSADIVVAVQAMHWMEPVSTLAEVARLLRPGGVFATVDADWPPVSGVAKAEEAWVVVHRRIRVFEARLAAGLDGPALRASIDGDDPALVDEDLADTHRNRAMPDGVRSWSKSEHLANITTSGHFTLARELLFGSAVEGGGGASADRFIALLRSQGSYQGVRRRGLTDADIGADVFDLDVRAAYARVAVAPPLSFSWRIRLGVMSSAAVSDAFSVNGGGGGY